MTGRDGGRGTGESGLGGSEFCVFADASSAHDAVEEEVEILRHLLSALARPDVHGLGCALCLLESGALRQLGGEHEGTEHVPQLLDAELVLERLGPHAVHDDAEGLEARRETAADLLDGPQRTVGGGDGEQTGLRHDAHAITRGPRCTRQSIEGRRTIDEDEVILRLDVRERLLELPDVTDRGVRSVEVDRRGAADHDVDSAGVRLRPPGRSDRLTHRLLLGRGEDIGDAQPAGQRDVHAGRHVGLRVEVDDERPDALRERRGGQTEADGGLADASLEAAHAEYMHNQIRYLYNG